METNEKYFLLSSVTLPQLIKDYVDTASVDKLNATIADIDAAKAEAGKVGIGATPSFVIGAQVIQEAMPYANFQAAINAELK